jgi:hypothetical protein
MLAKNILFITFCLIFTIQTSQSMDYFGSNINDGIRSLITPMLIIGGIAICSERATKNNIIKDIAKKVGINPVPAQAAFGLSTSFIALGYAAQLIGSASQACLFNTLGCKIIPLIALSSHIARTSPYQTILNNIPILNESLAQSKYSGEPAKDYFLAHALLTGLNFIVITGLLASYSKHFHFSHLLY